MKITLNPSRTAEELAFMCGGTLYVRTAAPLPSVSSICTDSREADEDTMLCAIRGERVDGHSFLPGAIRAGCRLCLCERLPAGWSDQALDGPLGDGPAAAIVVADTIGALSRLAAARRSGELNAMRTVAVTGSVGKTTTKEMIASVLAAGCRASGRAFKKDGNFNSVIGLPLSVMEIPADTTHAVLEMGMSGRGEISAMTAAARPDIALVTNIGSSHLELLGSRENIAAAKLEIAEGLRPGGILLLNGDEPLLDRVGRDGASSVPASRILRLSLAHTPGADFTVERMQVCEAGMMFDLSTPYGRMAELPVPAPGEHMVWAGAFAAAVGLLCGFSHDAIREGLSAYRPAALRQSRRTVGTVTLIEDCYNAAPESMRAALGVLDITAAQASTPARRVAILGSMLELGEHTEELHRGVGRMCAALGVDLLVTVGALGAHIAAGAREAGLPENRLLVLAGELSPGETDVTADYPAYAAHVATCLRPGDVLLFKASRSMKLESLSASLTSILSH